MHYIYRYIHNIIIFYLLAAGETLPARPCAPRRAARFLVLYIILMCPTTPLKGHPSPSSCKHTHTQAPLAKHTHPRARTHITYLLIPDGGHPRQMIIRARRVCLKMRWHTALALFGHGYIYIYIFRVPGGELFRGMNVNARFKAATSLYRRHLRFNI